MTDKEIAYQEAISILQMNDASVFRNVAYRLAKLDPELFAALYSSGVNASVLLAIRKKTDGKI
jgi:hypothetical protein